LRAPELFYDNDAINPNGGWLDIDYVTGALDNNNPIRLKTLIINVYDFTTQTPQSVFVGWQAQGFKYVNNEGSAIPLSLSPVNVYKWLTENNSNQIYIWQDVWLNKWYRDLYGNDYDGKSPMFRLNRWVFNNPPELDDEFQAPSFSGYLVGKPISCPEPFSVFTGDTYSPPSSFTAPLLFNLNTNIAADVDFNLPSRTDIAQPVLLWFNLMGGVEYQQLNVNEDGTIYKGKFSVKQNESVYYIDNANVKHEITNQRVIDSMQLSVTLMRERTAQSDRLSQLALSKNVYLFYGLAGDPPIWAKVPLLAKRNSFVRFEGATTVQLTMEFDFAQDVDIKI
jgi:hypothetical protein